MKDKVLKIGKFEDLDLEQTFDCGQCFRWIRQEDGSYSGIAYGQIGNIYIEEGCLTVRTKGEIGENQEVDRAFWRYYLDLDRDYGEIKRVLGEKDAKVAKAITSGQGIRILKQETWETIVSFIVSQQKQIPSIKKCVESLAQAFGEKAGTLDGKAYYSLPSPKVLAELSEAELAPVGLGYRAPYLIKSAKQIVECGILEKEPLGEFRQWKDLDNFVPVPELTGVGPKVENCIRLFGMNQIESFPIDTWIKKVMVQAYGFNEKELESMRKFAARQFGEYGGIAQQYLFYHIKKGLDF